MIFNIYTDFNLKMPAFYLAAKEMLSLYTLKKAKVLKYKKTKNPPKFRKITVSQTCKTLQLGFAFLAVSRRNLLLLRATTW